MKIDFLRNQIYPFQVWMLFGTVVVAHRIAKEERASEAAANAAAAEIPA